MIHLYSVPHSQALILGSMVTWEWDCYPQYRLIAYIYIVCLKYVSAIVVLQLLLHGFCCILVIIQAQVSQSGKENG